ncbi:MAG: hypothetical protein MH252_19680 [Thermosynechococcaceae cyanobacterium MS004]|nr:hypothetical protein [Thermosynechococcaceae cyanobacterium MS004]
MSPPLLIWGFKTGSLGNEGRGALWVGTGLKPSAAAKTDTVLSAIATVRRSQLSRSEFGVD